MLGIVFPVNIIHQRATRRGLLYLVIGGHAVNTYCEPRATLDLDFMVRKEDKSAWVEILAEEGFQLHHNGETFLQFLPPCGVEWRLDLMLVSSVTFDKMTAAAQTIELLGISAKIPNPMHLISLKLHALKHGHAERFDKDFGDVIGLTRNAGLDPRSHAYRELAERFGSKELYDKILERFPKPEA